MDWRISLMYSDWTWRVWLRDSALRFLPQWIWILWRILVCVDWISNSLFCRQEYSRQGGEEAADQGQESDVQRFESLWKVWWQETILAINCLFLDWLFVFFICFSPFSIRTFFCCFWIYETWFPLLYTIGAEFHSHHGNFVNNKNILWSYNSASIKNTVILGRSHWMRRIWIHSKRWSENDCPWTRCFSNALIILQNTVRHRVRLDLLFIWSNF